MAIRPGLCSVTFRALAPERIVALAARAGLAAIEWGGDRHVPAGDVARAAAVARMTSGEGLAVASYGSYFRSDGETPIEAVLDSAEALGAARVRVWAGSRGSAESSPADRARTVAHLQGAASAAEARGLSLALELHAGTLTDTAASTLRLLDEVDSTALSTYWQPAVGATDDAVLADQRVLAERTSALHVFSWWPGEERRPLRAREALWRRVFSAAASAAAPPRDALLEFVPDDDPELLAGEADALREYLSGSEFELPLSRAT